MRADNFQDATPFLQRALPLAKLGLRVYPLVLGHKHPLLPDYKRLATIDQEVLRNWAAKYPPANVGILIGERLMGEQATPYAVLDVDHRHHGDRSLALLETMHPALPMTWQVQSSDGQHIYLALPAHIHPLCQSKDLAPGITLLTAGHPLVGPGSIHPSGHVYQWMDCYDPGSVELVMMPHWLIDRGITQGVLCERRLPQSPIAASSQTPVLQRKRRPIAEEQKSPEKFSGNRVVLLANCRDEPEAIPGDEAGIPRQLTGETVKALLAQPWVAQRCIRLLKIPPYALSRRKFCCVLHQERHPSASLVAPRTPSEQWLYVDHHCKDDEPRTLPLPLVYFCKMTGQPTTIRLNTPELLTWSVRLLRDAGVLAGAEVRAPKLPADAPDWT